MHKYKLLGKKGEGTFSEVLKAQIIKNGKYVAIKRMKNHFDSIDQVNNLREIQALRRLSPHPNIIKLLEVLYDRQTGRLALVFELMDMNVYELIRGRRTNLPEERVKNHMYQLIKSMDHMHRNGIFHRDIKPENILIVDDKLKLADFGSCRGIYSKQPYTEYISTRWYRAPECLLTDGYYNYKMDMWGVGCVFFESMTRFPLFPGQDEVDQINKIHTIIGTPSAEMLERMRKHSQGSHMNFKFPQSEGTGIARLLPHATADCIDVIDKLLAYNPDDRLSARQALRHTYFREMREDEKRQHLAKTATKSGLPNIDGGDPPSERGPEQASRPGSSVSGGDSRRDALPNIANVEGDDKPLPKNSHKAQKFTSEETVTMISPIKKGKTSQLVFDTGHPMETKDDALPPLQKAGGKGGNKYAQWERNPNNSTSNGAVAGLSRNTLDPFGTTQSSTNYAPRDYYKPKIKPKRSNYATGATDKSYPSPGGTGGPKGAYGRR